MLESQNKIRPQSPMENNKKRHSAQQHQMLSVVMLSAVYAKYVFYCYAECCYAECHQAEYHYAGLSLIMLNGVRLTVVRLSVVEPLFASVLDSSPTNVSQTLSCYLNNFGQCSKMVSLTITQFKPNSKSCVTIEANPIKKFWSQFTHPLNKLDHFRALIKND